MKPQISLAKILEMGANGSIIVAAILFSVVLTKSYLGQPPDKKENPSPPPVTQKILQKGDDNPKSELGRRPNFTAGTVNHMPFLHR